MKQAFSLEQALSFPFSAPHRGAFFWQFGLCYALLFLALFGLIGLLSWGHFADWIRAVEQLDRGPEPTAGEVGNLFAAYAGRILPWGLLGALGSWTLWAMFEAASQRRYIWGQAFSLRLGADEGRLMAVGLLWGLGGFLLLALPILVLSVGTIGAVLEGGATQDPDVLGMQLAGVIFGSMAVMLLLGPVYIFFATRLAPCFALTVKEKRVRFFDAWHVSRGRFWPILLAYVILAVGSTFVMQLIMGLAQAVMFPMFLSMVSAAETADESEILAIFTSPGFLVSMGVLYFLMLFVQGIVQHVVGAPAALAARHDPRNDFGDAARVDMFS